MNRTSAVTRLLLALTLSAGGLGLAPTPAEAVTVLAEVTLRGGTIPDTTVGGSGVLQADFADSNSITDEYYTRTSGGDLESDATQGLMTGSILAGVEIPGSYSRLTPFAQMRVEQVDTYTVGAGSSGLANGDPVQVRIQARLSGRITIGGRPSGGSEIYFNVQGVPGVVGRWVDWSLGGLSPPQDIPFEEEWSTVADTTVGASFSLTSILASTMNGTAYDGPVVGNNTANGTALVRVSAAPGFGGIEITTAAGAPTTPLMSVPLLSRTALVLLVAALVAMGGMLARASSRAG